MADANRKQPPTETAEKIFDILQYELVDIQRKLQAEIDSQSHGKDKG
jgi:hypothetical protein